MSSAPRHEEHEEGGSSERWLVSYADFITLMFAFFAILYATSEKDMKKAQEFQESVKKYMIKAGGMGGSSAPQIEQSQKGNTVIESPLPTYKEGKPETLDTLESAESFIEKKLTPEERKKFVRDVTSDDWGVRIVLPATALYAPGSEKFRAEAIPFLAKVGELIAASKRKVLIEGHVAQGEVGSSRSTWDFSSARAVNLLRFLQAKQKFAADQIVAAALGDSKPDFADKADPGNSRVEIVLLNSEMEF